MTCTRFIVLALVAFYASNSPAEYAVEEAAAVLNLVDRGRTLHLEIRYPRNAGKSPVVVFHHGALCTAAGYGELAAHWASQGYVVLMPFHPASVKPKGRPDAAEQYLIFREQLADMSSVLDSFDAIGEQVRPLKPMLDPERVAAAGHSMGALIATTVSGLARSAPDGQRLELRDDRYDVAVLLSGPGPLPMTPEDAWAGVRLPTLVTTGTRDHANRGGEGADWEWRLGAFELTPPQGKFALIVDQADHFLGGAICPERVSTAPDSDAFAIVANVSTHFMNAYLKDDSTSRAALRSELVSAATQGRAELRVR